MLLQIDKKIKVCKYACMHIRTTLLLNENIKKSAQIKALEKNKSLSEVVNRLLEDYTSGRYEVTDIPVPNQHHLDEIKTTNLGLKRKKVDREMIYDLN